MIHYYYYVLMSFCFCDTSIKKIFNIVFSHQFDMSNLILNLKHFLGVRFGFFKDIIQVFSHTFLWV